MPSAAVTATAVPPGPGGQPAAESAAAMASAAVAPVTVPVAWSCSCVRRQVVSHRAAVHLAASCSAAGTRIVGRRTRTGCHSEAMTRTKLRSVKDKNLSCARLKQRSCSWGGALVGSCRGGASSQPYPSSCATSVWRAAPQSVNDAVLTSAGTCAAHSGHTAAAGILAGQYAARARMASSTAHAVTSQRLPPGAHTSTALDPHTHHQHHSLLPTGRHHCKCKDKAKVAFKATL